VRFVVLYVYGSILIHTNLRERIIMTKEEITAARTGCTVDLGQGRTFEMLIKYGVWYAIINTPFGVEYYGPLEDLEA